MKLSEVIEYIGDDDPRKIGCTEYIVFHVDCKPHVQIDNYLYCDPFKTMAYKSNKVDIKYIGYYLIFNMHLLKYNKSKVKKINRKVKKTNEGYELYHLTFEFIKNIEVPIPSLKVQKRYIYTASTSHNIMENYRNLISALFSHNLNLFWDIEESILDTRKLTDICTIKNKDLLFENVKKGNLDNPEEYLEASEFVTREYIVYYLYYYEVLWELDCRDKLKIGIEVPPIEYQNMLISKLKPGYEHARDLKNKKRETKNTLRKILNEILEE